MKRMLDRLKGLEPVQKKRLAVLAGCMLFTEVAYVIGHIVLIIAGLAGTILAGIALCRCLEDDQS